MRISIPNFKGADTIAQNLEDIGIKVAITTGRKSGDILKSKQKSRDMNTGTSVVYQIVGGAKKVMWARQDGGSRPAWLSTRGMYESTE